MAAIWSHDFENVTAIISDTVRDIAKLREFWTLTVCKIINFENCSISICNNDISSFNR